MPRSPEDNEIIRTARRDEIFRAAGRVFAKKGFAATKIDDIAAEAGLSHGLLYHYFKSKEAVYTALLGEMVHKRPSRAEIVGDARTGMERLERVLGQWIGKVIERPELGIVVTHALVADTLPKKERELFLRFSREVFDDLVSDIEAAQREGSATREVSAEELAVTLIATMRGISMARFVYSAIRQTDVVPSIGTILRIVGAGSREARPYSANAVVPKAAGSRSQKVLPKAARSRSQKVLPKAARSQKKENRRAVRA